MPSLYRTITHKVEYNNSVYAGLMVCAGNDTPIKVMAI